MSDVVDRESPAVLVARARRGEAEACTQLVRRYLRPAYAVALAVLRRPHEAEDVAQEALAIAFERLDTCREPERFAGWLMQIVRNRARNMLGQLRVREGDPGPVHAVVEPRTDAVGLRDRLIAALEQLTPAQREVVLLHDLEGWTHGEIAAALALTEVNSRQYLFQARKTLRGLLAEEAPTEVGDDEP